jgi:hypothetical protein
MAEPLRVDDGFWAVREPLLDGSHIRALCGKRGLPRQRPDRVIAELGYDHDKYRRGLRRPSCHCRPPW